MKTRRASSLFEVLVALFLLAVVLAAMLSLLPNSGLWANKTQSQRVLIGQAERLLYDEPWDDSEGFLAVNGDATAVRYKRTVQPVANSRHQDLYRIQLTVTQGSQSVSLETVKRRPS